MTTAEQQRNIFWNMFERELEKQGAPFHICYFSYYATVNRRSARSNYCLSMDFLVQKGFLRVGIFICDNVPTFEYMYSQKDEIEKLLGFQPKWTIGGERNPNTRRIEIHIPFVGNVNSYLKAIQSAILYIKKFKQVIPRYSLERLFDY